MPRDKSKTTGVVLLVAVMIIAFMFVTPLFRFSCSRVFMHDFLGVDDRVMAPTLALSYHNMAYMVPLLVMVLLWGAVALWVYHDAERRGHSGLLWGLFVFIGNLIGLIIYLILRFSSVYEPETGAGTTAKCPGCSGTIRSTYVACPYCGRKLASSCQGCGKQVETDWKACPWCGTAIDVS